MKAVGRRLLSWHERLRQKLEKGLSTIIRRVYGPAIAYVVENRYFTFSIGLGVLIVSLGVVSGGYVPFVFFPKGESDWVMIDVTYPLGTPVEITETAIAHMEAGAYRLNDDFRERIRSERELVVHSFSLVGMIPRRDWKPGQNGGHAGTVMIELLGSENRPDLSVNEVISRWRRHIGEIPGIDQMTFATLEGGPAGNPIEIQLIGDDFPAHGSRGPGHFALGIRPKSLDAWRKHLTSSGVAIEQERSWPLGGVSIYFRDPAGNLCELITPGVWGTSAGW